jgi:hypothetical protein
VHDRRAQLVTMPWLHACVQVLCSSQDRASINEDANPTRTYNKKKHVRKQGGSASTIEEKKLGLRELEDSVERERKKMLSLQHPDSQNPLAADGAPSPCRLGSSVWRQTLAWGV